MLYAFTGLLFLAQCVFAWGSIIDNATLARLWDGQDMDDDDAFHEQFSSDVSDEQLGIEIMGLFDTGTNLLGTMLQSNFAGQFTTYGIVPPNAKPGVWKHADPTVLLNSNRSDMAAIVDAKVAVIAMIRDPLSWFQSLRKAPYQLHLCVDGEDWLTKPCAHGSPGGPNSTSQVWSNLAHMWADWSGSYKRLMEAGVPNVVTVRYEDLVVRPEEVITEIANALDLTLPESILSVDRAAKASGDPSGRQEAVDKINNKSYLENYLQSELDAACTSLAPWSSVLEEFSYDVCPKPVQSFLKRHG
mmetsp:Transcript_63107/g.137140  ORF Transcript_63107/g.137140 Transcript_63107/m.137140 type:complete len:301 (-) Transcript_63107:156-1058(-)